MIEVAHLLLLGGFRRVLNEATPATQLLVNYAISFVLTNIFLSVCDSLSPRMVALLFPPFSLYCSVALSIL